MELKAGKLGEALKSGKRVFNAVFWSNWPVNR